jgi:hypothetical protein
MLAVPEGVAGLLGGAVAVGVAYLLGILGDRLADTLTEDLERHHRLRFALTWPVLRSRQQPTIESEWKDPFPENAFRLAALRETDAAVAWLDYHRSRVRLTRALTVFLPALAVAAVLGVGRLEPRTVPGLETPPRSVPGPVWVSVVPVVYGLVIWRITVRRARRAGGPLWLLAPRTNQPEAYAYGEEQGFAADDDASRRLRRRTLARAVAADPAVQGVVTLHLSAVTLAFASGSQGLWALALVATVLTALSGWSWWRISATYRHYLREVGESPLASRG